MTGSGRMRFKSYSANFEDVILNRLFAACPTGFYVDVGAAHPTFENDTKALYDRGWRGINIEPTRDFFEALVTQRPEDRNLNVAVSEDAGEMAFYEVVGTGLSTGSQQDADRAAEKGFDVVRHSVPAIPLRDVLAEAEAGTIDVLKVDVEGFEMKVLRSNDWDRFRPRVILTEATYPETPERRGDEVRDYLAAQRYQHVYFDALNDWFVEQDFTVPEGAFTLPPNVFDHFAGYQQEELEQALHAAASQVEALLTERAAQQRYTASLQEELARRDVQRQETERYVASLQAGIEEQTRRIVQLDSRAVRQTQRIVQLDSRAVRQEALIRDLEAQLRRADMARLALAEDIGHARTLAASLRERCHALGLELDAAMLREHAALASAGAAAGQNTKVAADAARTSEQVARLSEQLTRMYSSSSWRLTRPLRAIARPGRTIRILLGRPS